MLLIQSQRVRTCKLSRLELPDVGLNQIKQDSSLNNILCVGIRQEGQVHP